MEDKWINDIRKQAADYRRKAPEGLLDDIKREMGVRKQPRLSLVWGRRIAVAAAVAIAAVLVVRNLPNGNNGEVADKTPTAIKSGKDGSTVYPTHKDVNNDSGVAVNSSSTSVGSWIQNVVGDIIGKVEDGGKEFVAVLTGASSDNAGEEGTTSSTENAPMVADATTMDSKAQGGNNTIMESPRQKKMTKSWYGSGEHDYVSSASSTGRNGFSLSMNYSGMSGNSNGAGSPGLMVADGVDYIPLEANNFNEFSNLKIAQSETTTNAHHDMPIKVGVNVRYNINNRWSVQTGVNYSYLSSDISRYNNLGESSSKQKLHYVSVPLTASYSVWHNKNFNVYLSAGGEAAKLVKGKADVERTSYDGTGTTKSKENVSEHRMQYSVNGAAGVEFKAGNRVSVYAEPGVSHYFNNHSSVTNIYKDKPTQFTINVGLRISLH